MKSSIFSPEVTNALQAAQTAAATKTVKTVLVDGTPQQVPYPFPSPVDWRDCWIYFLLTDRFNNPQAPPKSTQRTPAIAWDGKYDFHQGGTYKGIQQQLGYIASLGAGAIWISPVVKNFKPDTAAYVYPGYSTQDFLTLDGRFASDGTSATAEKELTELVEEAHARGLFVIIDIVLNHATRAFDYEIDHTVKDHFTSQDILDGPPGSEPSIQWLNGFGFPRADWRNDDMPSPAGLSADDAVWPQELQRADFFRRRGNKISDKPGPAGFAKGDFGVMRQLVVEYLANSPQQAGLRNRLGVTPVLNILIQAYQYLMARFDIDGYRIDTVKYVDPNMVERFGNAIREFALGMGKKNFFTFGEVYDDEETIARFVGRNSTETDSFGIDAALDFPLFFKLPGIVKGTIGVENLCEIFTNRKKQERGLISTHGEAGKFFVTFLDNHDQNERFNHPQTPQAQVILGLAIQFCLQGIPSIYYGTEQGLNGTKQADGMPDLGAMESVREALWGKTPAAFDPANEFYTQIQVLSGLRRSLPALRYGRLYFREVSGNGEDFGIAHGTGGVVAFSRILGATEVTVVANTSSSSHFKGWVIQDIDLSRQAVSKQLQYSNLQTTGTQAVQAIPAARIFEQNILKETGAVTALPVNLQPMEVQVWI